jgi:hypothetical protein
MSDPRSAVLKFLQEFWGETKPLQDDSDLFGELGIDGDDAFEFIDKFTVTFGIDASNYRWYFHHGEEGQNLGGLFFAPPYRCVDHIPVTLKTLIGAVETKLWPITYPDHKLPRVRWDLRLNQAFALLAFGGLALWLWQRFGR